MSPGRILLITAAVVYGLLNPEVLNLYTDRLYVHTVSAPLRPAVEQLLALNHQVRQVETAYERRGINKPQARAQLLNLYDRYGDLLARASQSNTDPYERNEILVKIQENRAAIDNWGVEHGF